MSKKNMIVFMTDELRRDSLGCYGNAILKTPNIDALAAQGLRFDAAYTPSPICVPARASIATGRYVHEVGCWTNAQPYTGTPDSWHHKLRDAGYDMLSIGKLHFRGNADDNGFTQEINPLHIRGGLGWVHGLLRDEPDLFDASGFADNIGPGNDPYSAFDEAVCAAAVDWIKERSARRQSDPWCLYVSFLRPHYPLTCPPKFYDLYDPDALPLPRPSGTNDGADHPVLEGLRHACDYDAYFDDEKRRIAVASYYGLCSFVDDLVGQIMTALEETEFSKTTNVIFTSDHGECLGDRGFWTKMVMYDEAAAVPLIMSGPDIAPDVCRSPVSLIDLYPTLLELAGIPSPPDAPKHAHSLLETGRTALPERAVLSEYHDYGAQTGMFMLRRDGWKLVVYPGFAPQLFDLENDPEETRDLARHPENGGLVADLLKSLCAIVDPDVVNARAFADQAQRIEELGGRDAVRSMQNFDHTPVETLKGNEAG